MKTLLCWLLGHRWEPYVSVPDDAGCDCLRCGLRHSLVKKEYSFPKHSSAGEKP